MIKVVLCTVFICFGYYSLLAYAEKAGKARCDVLKQQYRAERLRTMFIYIKTCDDAACYESAVNMSRGLVLQDNNKLKKEGCSL